ncbi:hypothetical protein F511_29151 [Dorcoceras hygrometricum]|uniref:Uncharacterized protein n=1 Tax=Dorcoceras hygrometricum TaxID=472368 RepID=A0A2Z7CBV0_9LAMI|nr:hypothetical protein F511_29151 [Dorcoceras hygrometricum]
MAQSEPRLRRGSSPSLHKQNSWSPDIIRNEVWNNRRRNHRHRRGRSVTDDDLDELRACIDLGFNFNSPDLDPKLSSTFPALGFFHAVNRQYSDSLSRSSSASLSDSDSALSSVGGSSSFIDPGDSPEMVKNRLRHWAQVVACSVRQSSPNLIIDQSGFSEKSS